MDMTALALIAKNRIPKAVPCAKLWAPDRARQRRQLLMEREILERDRLVSTADQTDRSEEYH
jgi:hypothetical protein